MTATEETPEQLRSLLLQTMLGEPPAPPVEELVAHCQSAHRRHRLRLGLAGATAVALAALVPIVVVGVSDADRPSASTTPDVATLSDEQVVKLCEDGNQALLTDPWVISGLGGRGGGRRG